MRNSTVLFILIAIVAGFVLACGCQSAVPASDTTPAATAHAKDAGIRIITEEFPPFNYAGEDGKVTGQATEVVHGILAGMNQKADIAIMPWSDGYSAALAGPGVALYSTARTDEREPLFKWVGPVTTYHYVLYAADGSAITIDSLEAAKKAGTIAVVKDDARHQFLLQNKFTDIVTCGTDAECLDDLLSGKVDLWLGSSPNAAAIAKIEGIDPSRFHEVYSVRSVDMYIAFSKDTPDSVIAEWQKALDAMKADGTYTTILEKYGLETAGADTVSAQAGDQADLALSAMIAQTDGRLTPVLRVYQVLAITSEAQSGDWQKIMPLLSALEAQAPDARTWYALTDGSYYTVVDGLTTGNLKSRTYFPDVLAGRTSVGSTVVSLSTGKNAAIVAVPVMKQGSVSGILGASVYMDTLTDTLRQTIPEPFVFYAIDKEGKFAIHSDKGQISRDTGTIGIASSYGQALAVIKAQESGSISYDDGGTLYKAAFRTSPLTGWRFVVAWPAGTGTTG